MATTERGRIASGGCGGFLNPPLHPEHSLHVETDLHRKKCNRGMLSLSYAVTCDWLDRETRHAARQLLNRWAEYKPSLSDPTVDDWICHTLGYFRSCYVAPYGSTSASDLIVRPDLNPLANCHMHAGVRHIRKFYPEFHPSAEHFRGAYWGTKPGA